MQGGHCQLAAIHMSARMFRSGTHIQPRHIRWCHNPQLKPRLPTRKRQRLAAAQAEGPDLEAYSLQLGILQKYVQQGTKGQADSSQIELPPGPVSLDSFKQGAQVNWPVAVLSFVILVIFFVTSTQRVLGLDRFLLAWVRQRKDSRKEQEQNDVANARARFERSFDSKDED